MPISAVERRFILDQLVSRSKDDMIRLWDAAARFEDVDFFTYVSGAFPDIALGYHKIAADFSAQWFENDFPNAQVAVAELPDRSKYQNSAQWALGADGTDALDRMAGTLQRAVYDGDRETTLSNATNNGMRWVRVARPDACAFCRLAASRTKDLFRSEENALRVVGRSTNLSLADRRMISAGFMTREEALARREQQETMYQIGSRKGTSRSRRTRGSRALGEKYHDHCYCTAQAIPMGVDTIQYLYEVEPQYAELAEQWGVEYDKAVEMAGSSDATSVLAAWRQLDVGAK
jgi:hypothetical protein